MAEFEVGRVAVREGWLRVWFSTGAHADFHFRWLRHNCDLDRHPQTRERTVDSSELPERLGVTLAAVIADSLAVTWAHDGRESRYPLSWLAEHAYARDRVDEPPPADLWSIEVHGRGRSLDTLVDEALARLDASGAVVVRRDPADVTPPEEQTDTIVDCFAAHGLGVIATHFGRIEDLRTDNSTNKNTDQLGYTNSPVDLHTDQPFIDRPPRLQLLQGIRAAELGGENYIVDARAAARYLRSLDARAFQLLTTVPVRFHRKQKAFESLVVAPILRFDGDAFQTRYSYFTMAPYDYPFNEMEEWYRAYDLFARLVREPRHQYRFALNPGDFLLYDNHRMLHARTGFRGARWVRGIYFDR